MTSSDRPKKDLLSLAQELIAKGYERMSVVDAARGEELAELYEELGHEVVTLPGAVPEENQECAECLDASGIVTIFVKKR